MKKRLALYLLLVFVVTNILFLSNFALINARTINFPSQISCSDKSVLSCGSSPDSVFGFGAVELCGYCFTCNSVADGVCPEDFYSAGTQGSCAHCPDPDCVSSIDGFVKSDTGTLLSGANISIKYFGDQFFSVLTTSVSNGSFFANLASGEDVEVYATYDDSGVLYSSPITNITLERNKTTHVNFTLTTASCAADCTLKDGICHSFCQGVNGCSFPSDNNMSSNDTANILDGTKDGDHALLRTEEGTYSKTDYYVTRCVGPILNRTIISSAPDENSSFSKSNLIDESKLNLITKNIRVYSSDGEVVTMVVVYWDDSKEI